MRQQLFRSVGVMSGTSLDGLDIALCEFSLEDDTWGYQLVAAETYPYDDLWRERLSLLHHARAGDFWKTHIEYGRFIGEKVNVFLKGRGLSTQLICSHGHTVFHRPEQGYTMQAGAGEAIAAVTGLPVVSDLRSADLALGGQGAPLVPIGDKLLFQEYEACLNIGGFSNASLDRNGERIAFDICPSNIILNRLSSKLGYDYDENGRTARKGQWIPQVSQALNELPFYEQNPPKSLGREWLEDFFLPVLLKGEWDTVDLLRTVTEHIGYQIGRSLEVLEPGKVLVTGGGAYNAFLMECIAMNSRHKLVVPETPLIDFKEALVFAFLGVLRYTRRVNVLASVTGAAGDHSGGSLFDLFPAKK